MSFSAHSAAARTTLAASLGVSLFLAPGLAEPGPSRTGTVGLGTVISGSVVSESVASGAREGALLRSHAVHPELKPSEPWRWPLPARPRFIREAVLRAFDPPAQPWLSGHRGVDLAAGAAGMSGDPRVLAPAAGVVSFRGFVVDRPVITIDHGAGIKSSFEPVRSNLKVGTAVVSGQVIGTLIAGHCPGQACIHWGVRRSGEYVDPLSFILDLRPSILLPLGNGHGPAP